MTVKVSYEAGKNGQGEGACVIEMQKSRRKRGEEGITASKSQLDRF